MRELTPEEKAAVGLCFTNDTNRGFYPHGRKERRQLAQKLNKSKKKKFGFKK